MTVGIRSAMQLVSAMGPSWVAWRSLYELELRAGVLRRQFPPVDLPHLREKLAEAAGVSADELGTYLFERWSTSRARFFLEPEINCYRAVVGRPDRVLEIAHAAERGTFLFFSRWWAELGNPPDWLVNPANGCRFPESVHWSQIPDLSAELGDIKYVWEASRHAQVYHYVRAYAVTSDERYAEAFWSQFEHWVASNLPEMGPHWRCGQEVALRSLAWVFGLYAFRQSLATTPHRVSLLLQYIWYQAWHIERIHWYAARCVRNNHAISEAAALFTIGTLFPFLPDAAKWRNKGYRFLIQEAMWQIYDDGSYVQHSMNYARLVVQLFTWCLRVGQVNGTEFPATLKERLRKLLHFLRSMQDTETGRVPNYGSNDGALIFPLTSCDYLDYRPALNALSVALGDGPLYGRGLWEEETAWFFGPGFRGADKGCAQSGEGAGASNVRVSSSVAGEAFPTGGYYILRGTDTFGMIRCGRYRHRPSQADMLHLDVWYSGQNVLVDPGTYSYNLPPEWSHYFSGTAAHNTVTVDGKDQMKKGKRFVWLNWVQGRALSFQVSGSVGVFVGEHSGYAPVIHRRLVVLQGNVWVIIDDLFGDASNHTYTLHWLVGDFELHRESTGAEMGLTDGGGKRSALTLRVTSSRPGTGTWVGGDEKTPRGWQSLYYGEKVPAWSYQLQLQNAGSVRFGTMLGPTDVVKDWRVSSIDDMIQLIKSWGVEPPAAGIPTVFRSWCKTSQTKGTALFSGVGLMKGGSN